MTKIVKNQNFNLKRFNRRSKIHEKFPNLHFLLKLMVSKVDINNKNVDTLTPQKYTHRSTRHSHGFPATIKMAPAGDLGQTTQKAPYHKKKFIFTSQIC